MARQHVVQTGRFRDGRGRRALAEFFDFVGECAGTAPAAQDNLMSAGKRLMRNGKRDLTRTDRPNPHRPVLSIFREA